METDSLLEPLLSLLQLSDSAIPIGGYSHSFALETWIQNGVIHSRSTAKQAIETLLVNSVAPQDGVAAGLAHQYSLVGATDKVTELNQILSAGKWSKELFQASVRMGTRLLKLAHESDMVPSLAGLPLQTLTGDRVSTIDWHHAVAFGWLAGCAGVAVRDAISSYLQSSSNCLISACVRLIPLGHTDGQCIIVSLRPLIARLASECVGRDVDDIAGFAPLHEAASYEHESLYSRLFQS